ncbi:MAG: hypothetical protein ICV86_02080 [Microcoleus sp. T3-bin5]|nr:hypothetical protein [Microcoleus sp. T3-bin5]
MGIQGETLHLENAASFAVSACGLVARPAHGSKYRPESQFPIVISAPGA